LMERCFERLTAFQASKFKIQGKAVRMDSKLIGSNIAWYSRYELIHKTFLQEMPHTLLKGRNEVFGPKPVERRHTVWGLRLGKKRVVHIKVIFFFLMMAGNQQARHHRKQQFFIHIPNY
ncbi:MAG: hypothetical protein IKX13_03545, partial [Bacteroidales bacterium]|nr:hypothetical protein [Bacteroidales bacterium]